MVDSLRKQQKIDKTYCNRVLVVLGVGFVVLQCWGGGKYDYVPFVMSRN
jgi:hypothetical protein